VRSAECGMQSEKLDKGNAGDLTQRPQAGRARGEGTAKKAGGGRRPGIAVRDSARSKRSPRRAPGVAVFRGRVLTTSGFEAASSRLPAAPAACSPDLLGRGMHDGAIFSPFSSVSPLPAGFRGRVRNPAAEARWKRAQEQRDSEDGGCRPVFLGLKGRG